jgi:hypothetical protein
LEELVSLDDLANGRLRNRCNALLTTVCIEQHFELLLAKASVPAPVLTNELYNALITLHPTNPTRPGAVRHKSLNPTIASAQPLPPHVDYLTISPKGFFCGCISIVLVKPKDLHPLLRYFALIKPPKTSQHTL